jgi:lipase chaperone LimK
MRANARIAVLGAALLAGGLLYFMYRAPAPLPQAAPRATADPFAFVRSMEGTRPDGDIRQGGTGQLVVDAELRHLFDYYLAALGEKDLDAIRGEIERELERRLAPAAATQARRLLASYLDYKRALADLEKGRPASGTMAQSARARFDAMQRLRTRFFNPRDSAGLFGASDALDADALARLEISQDRSLTDARRADKLAALERHLPASVRIEREAPLRIIRLEDAAQALRKQGASDDELYRLRAAALSPAAANRLAELDREEDAWKRRIDAYLALRRQLPAGDGALPSLRDQHFSAREQLRLGAYE